MKQKVTIIFAFALLALLLMAMQPVNEPTTPSRGAIVQQGQATTQPQANAADEPAQVETVPPLCVVPTVDPSEYWQPTPGAYPYPAP